MTDAERDGRLLPTPAGTPLWLRRRSHRRFTAGPDVLHYLTVHQRRHTLGLDTVLDTAVRQEA